MATCPQPKTEIPPPLGPNSYIEPPSPLSVLRNPSYPSAYLFYRVLVTPFWVNFLCLVYIVPREMTEVRQFSKNPELGHAETHRGRCPTA